MKRIMKPVIMALLATSVFATSVSPLYAKSDYDDEFEVDLDSYIAGDESSVYFELDMDDAQLVEGQVISVKFPSGWDVPKKIDEEDVEINGEEVEDVKVSGRTVKLTIPEDVDGDDELEIEFFEDAGLVNPDKADDDYVIEVSLKVGKEVIVPAPTPPPTNPTNPTSVTETVYGSTTPPTQKPTTKIVLESREYESEEIEIKEPKKVKPVPLPAPIYVTKTLEVGLQIGSTSGSQYYAENGVGTKRTMILDTAPFTRNGSTLVPLRFVADGLGVQVAYNEARQTAVLNLNGKTVTFTNRSRVASVDGHNVDVPVAPEIINGRMMVPLRFIAESLGAVVGWDGQTQSISIKKTSTDKQ